MFGLGETLSTASDLIRYSLALYQTLSCRCLIFSHCLTAHLRLSALPTDNNVSADVKRGWSLSDSFAALPCPHWSREEEQGMDEDWQPTSVSLIPICH